MINVVGSTYTVYVDPYITHHLPTCHTRVNEVTVIQGPGTSTQRLLLWSLRSHTTTDRGSHTHTLYNPNLTPV